MFSREICLQKEHKPCFLVHFALGRVPMDFQQKSKHTLNVFKSSYVFAFVYLGEALAVGLVVFLMNINKRKLFFKWGLIN